MIQLGDFDGVRGFRWGIYQDAPGTVHLSENAPLQREKELALIAKIFSTQFPYQSSDLLFAKGKVLVRRGGFGLLILFCDDSINAAMVDIVLDEQSGSHTGVSDSTNTSGLDSNLSVVTSITRDVRLVPRTIIDELVAIYTEYLGPLAPMLAQKDARTSGLDLDNIQSKDWSHLLNTMAARIEMPAKRDAFLDRAVLLKTKF